MRVAGYSDPFERRAAEDYRDRFEPEPSEVAAGGVRGLGACRWSARSTS